MDYGWGLYKPCETYNRTYYKGQEAIDKLQKLVNEGYHDFDMDGEYVASPCNIELYKTKRPKDKSYQYSIDLV